MSYSSKNYLTQGGDEWVIGGKLTIQDGAEVTGLGPLHAASNQTESTATTIADLRSDVNSLLQKLKDAGLMEGDVHEGQ